MEADIKGDIYEGLLSKSAAESPKGAGQYFTPRELINKLNAEVSTLVNTPEISERLRAIQFVPATGSPESFGEVIRSDLARWSRVARDAKIGGG